MKKLGKKSPGARETLSLDWIHKIRAERARKRGGKRLTELSDAEWEEEFAAGRELAEKLGLKQVLGPVSKTS